MNKNTAFNSIWNLFVLFFTAYVRDSFLTKTISNHIEAFIIYALLMAILLAVGMFLINKYFPPKPKNK